MKADLHFVDRGEAGHCRIYKPCSQLLDSVHSSEMVAF